MISTLTCTCRGVSVKSHRNFVLFAFSPVCLCHYACCSQLMWLLVTVMLTMSFAVYCCLENAIMFMSFLGEKTVVYVSCPALQVWRANVQGQLLADTASEPKKMSGTHGFPLGWLQWLQCQRAVCQTHWRNGCFLARPRGLSRCALMRLAHSEQFLRYTNTYAPEAHM